MNNSNDFSPAKFPEGEQTVFISGPVGRLEMITHFPASGMGTDTNKLAIICHPHSLQGGTMNNKVVHTLAKLFRDQGFYTLRFNFRGVGKSEGHYDQGEGESEDVLAVWRWAQSVLPKKIELSLAGFSFGSYVSLKTANRMIAQGVIVKQLISIAPPVGNFPLEAESRPPCSWIIVQGEQDEVIDSSRVMKWISTLNPAPEVIAMQGAGHFFHGKLIELRSRLEKLLLR